MRRLVISCAAAAAFTLVACVPNQRMYTWGGYDSVLYKHYKTPADRVQYVEGLKTIVAEAEQAGNKVPPGIYAEYGWALYEEGQRDAAVTYFEKESALWPEAKGFMDKMIANAKRMPAPSTAGGEAAAAQTAEGGAK